MKLSNPNNFLSFPYFGVSNKFFIITRHQRYLYLTRSRWVSKHAAQLSLTFNIYSFFWHKQKGTKGQRKEIWKQPLAVIDPFLMQTGWWSVILFLFCISISRLFLKERLIVSLLDVGLINQFQTTSNIWL